MGFLPGLAKATTVQNNSSVAAPTMTSDQYLNFANQAGKNALSGQDQYLANLQAQQGLAGQYQNIANGQGPNPAQAMLAQQTGNNIATQNALMAGQRGASSNVGLLARQGAMQGANTQQQAVGQGATLQAQQQLGALQGMGGLYGQMGQQINGQQNANSGLLNIAGSLNNAQNAQQIGVQEANAGIEQANANTAQGALSGLASGTGAAGSSLMSGMGGSDSGGGSSGGSSGASAGMMAGMMATGGEVIDGFKGPSMGPSSSAGQFLAGPDLSPNVSSAPTDAPSLGVSSGGKGKDSPGKMLFAMAQGGKVPVMLSPGEEYLSPTQAKKVIHGKMNPLAGKKIHGKASVPGDSLKNDTVPDKLEAGGVVIPRSVMQSSDPTSNAAKFVAAVLAKGASKSKKGKK